MSRDATREYEVETKDGALAGIVEVSGRWIAGSLEYGPPDSPDATITKAWRLADEDNPEREVRPAALTDDEADALIAIALEKDEYRDDDREDDGPPPPR